MAWTPRFTSMGRCTARIPGPYVLSISIRPVWLTYQPQIVLLILISVYLFRHRSIVPHGGCDPPARISGLMRSCGVWAPARRGGQHPAGERREEKEESMGDEGIVSLVSHGSTNFVLICPYLDFCKIF